MNLLDRKNVFAVVGASKNEEKFGFKVFKILKEEGYKVYPVNPNADEILDERVYPTISDVPEKIDVVVTVVPPAVTEKIVKEVEKLKIKNVWMQPGSESEKAIKFCKEKKINCVHSACIVFDGLKRSF